jgi:hypothetical protein
MRALGLIFGIFLFLSIGFVFAENDLNDCLSEGYKCTSRIRGCGEYEQFDLSCESEHSVCCSDIPKEVKENYCTDSYRLYFEEGPSNMGGLIFDSFKLSDIEYGLQIEGVSQFRIPAPGKTYEKKNMQFITNEREDEYIEFCYTIDDYIYSEGSYFLKEGFLVEINGISAEVEEISWALSGDTEPKIVFSYGTGGTRTCMLHEGEHCKFTYGPTSNPTFNKLKATASEIIINEKDPENSVAIVSLEKIMEEIIEIKPEEDEYVEIDYENLQEGKSYSCQGCLLNDTCYPLGYRKDGEFCSDSKEFMSQLEGGYCNNNFECESNVCVDSECVSGGLFRRILDWFRNFFR